MTIHRDCLKRLIFQGITPLFCLVRCFYIIKIKISVPPRLRRARRASAKSHFPRLFALLLKVCVRQPPNATPFRARPVSASAEVRLLRPVLIFAAHSEGWRCAPLAQSSRPRCSLLRLRSIAHSALAPLSAPPLSALLLAYHTQASPSRVKMNAPRP